MIRIQGMILDPNTILSQIPSGPIEKEIILRMSSSSFVYAYASPDQLKFELDLRKSTVTAALALNSSHLSFRTFRDAVCNPDYWIRTEEGGFLLREGARPYQAIKDIYINSAKYGTECATAMVIVFYGALLAMLPEPLYNQWFPVIYLMDWQHLDPQLGLQHYRNLPDYFPGDCRYFKNPDVSPITPEWQGENAIDLGNGTYYGHGIGIGTADQIIASLNRNRIAGSETSAFLMDTATRMDYKSLWEKSHYYGSQLQMSGGFAPWGGYGQPAYFQ